MQYNAHMLRTIAVRRPQSAVRPMSVQLATATVWSTPHHHQSKHCDCPQHELRVQSQARRSCLCLPRLKPCAISISATSASPHSPHLNISASHARTSHIMPCSMPLHAHETRHCCMLMRGCMLMRLDTASSQSAAHTPTPLTAPASSVVPSTAEARTVRTCTRAHACTHANLARRDVPNCGPRSYTEIR